MFVNKKCSSSALALEGRGLGRGCKSAVQSGNIQKFAFTLAEVLITLGIIGVVAAITMPTLIQNYQKQVYVNQLKKTVSMLEQGFQKMLADEGVERLSDLSYWSNYNSYTSASARLLVDDFFNKGFKAIYDNQPAYNISTHIWGNYEDGYDNNIHFPDGSTINEFFATSPIIQRTPAQCETIKALGGRLCSLAITFLQIDINGIKKPNQFGRDVFFFYVSDEGKLYPLGGKDYALFVDQTSLASNHCYWKNNGSCGCIESAYNSTGCAGRIIENGWKMDY